jgi:hypothetical protein
MARTSTTTSRRPSFKTGAATAALLLFVFATACGLLPGGGDEAEASDETDFEVSEESTFPTDEEFAAQQAAAAEEAAAAAPSGGSAGGGEQSGELAIQLAAEVTKSASLQARVDELANDLAEARAIATKNASSTLVLLATQMADLELEKIEAISSTIAVFESEYISLERARLEAIRYAREYPDIYGFEYIGIDLAWELESEAESEEFYYVRLHYRPSGTFLGTPGIEEFVMDKEGTVQFRQILREPSDEPPPPEPEMPEEPEIEEAVTSTPAT